MAFTLVTSRGPRSGRPFGKLSATVFTKGDVLARSNPGGNVLGDVIPATSATSSSDLIGVGTESVAAADARLDVHGMEWTKDDLFIADSLNNSSENDNFERMTLVDAQTVNNSGVDNETGVVVQYGVVGAPSDKKILVKFVQCCVEPESESLVLS